jgi:hypothetical protein
MNYIIIIVIVIVVLLLLSSVSVSAYFALKSKQPTPTPAPVTTPAPAPAQQPITKPVVTKRPRITLPPRPPVSVRLPISVDDINSKFAWQTMQNAGDRDKTDLDFLKTCSKPWDAMYQVGCTIDGITYKSKILGPVSKDTQQAPRIRVGDYGGNNICTKMGGELAVYRKRQNDDNMIDITQYIKNKTADQMYDRKDALFVDDYLSDC